MRVACVALAAVFLLEGSPVQSGGPANPWNLFIAKSKKGTYRSKVLDIDQPAANPQKYTKKIEPGQTAKFFVKLKNSGPGDFNTRLSFSGNTPGYTVAIFLDGVEVTSTYAGQCVFSDTVPAGKKLLFQYRITATTAPVGDKKDFAAIGFLDSGCTERFDAVWAIVKVV
ncbi:MAG: hypothetical protein WD826_11880 [Actinomycetota bacterium]